jgi:hypothetical protein
MGKQGKVEEWQGREGRNKKGQHSVQPVRDIN